MTHSRSWQNSMCVRFCPVLGNRDICRNSGNPSMGTLFQFFVLVAYHILLTSFTVVLFIATGINSCSLFR